MVIVDELLILCCFSVPEEPDGDRNQQVSVSVTSTAGQKGLEQKGLLEVCANGVARLQRSREVTETDIRWRIRAPYSKTNLDRSYIRRSKEHKFEGVRTT
jgi:hypothetical protein